MKHRLFSYHLYQTVLSRRIKPVDLATRLGYHQPHILKPWLEGKSLPPLRELLPIAEALDMDPVELVLIWAIDQCPALEPVLWREILGPRGSQAPRWDDPMIQGSRLPIKMA